jgi:hypothetical protein
MLAGAQRFRWVGCGHRYDAQDNLPIVLGPPKPWDRERVRQLAKVTLPACRAAAPTCSHELKAITHKPRWSDRWTATIPLLEQKFVKGTDNRNGKSLRSLGVGLTSKHASSA